MLQLGLATDVRKTINQARSPIEKAARNRSVLQLVKTITSCSAIRVFRAAGQLRRVLSLRALISEQHMSSFLEQYRIADFLEWHKEKRLELNPNFQRAAVWTPAARTFLIDTILRELPIPKVYLRTKMNVVSKKSVREVVDGQQRLRAIIDFANDKLTLSKRAGEFAGLTYSSMSEQLQEKFLGYPIAVDQLLNASDAEVLEVFARLNSYSVALNHAEKRHARYQGDFKWTVRKLSATWSPLWEAHEVFSVRDRLRMEDDSFTAELLGILLLGVQDGGQVKIDHLYRDLDPSFKADDPVVSRFNGTIEFFDKHLATALAGTSLLRPPHLLMLLAALAHQLHGLPQGALADDEFPARQRLRIKDVGTVVDNLTLLASFIDDPSDSPGLRDFTAASSATTHRIASRRIRFRYYVSAISPDSLI
ncbi:DUF262 domain-containing protein [Achromobacter sp. D10]|uniref:DUF262 domain-containing protein n=1 Tax=Achromobacter sp. D10 TaxID=3110765 RepID=UPI002B464245|nr:DUF262 domain-containing protein [Achromobacter sp. D10]MEB3099370.1 DUF262 domain-containing protein [Achromobacter sp. D10]